MKRLMLAPVLALLFAFEANAQQAPPPPVAPIPAQVQRTIDRLQAAALRDNNGYDIVESFVTEVGPRLGGSPSRSARARLGRGDAAPPGLHQRPHRAVHDDRRGTRPCETAAVISPIQQPLASQRSAARPRRRPAGSKRKSCASPTWLRLEAAPDAAVRGRIVFIDEPMTRTQDGSGYGAAVAQARPLARAWRKRRARRRA